MKPRDRLVVSVLAAAALLVVVWVAFVSPKRQDATRLGTQLTAAQAQLGSAQSSLGAAKAAEAGYPSNLRVVKSLYKAVPANDGVPHLLVTLDKTSHFKRVDFKVITVAAPTTATAPAAGAAALPAGLSPTSFTFTFNGGYIDLQHFLKTIAHFTLVQGNKVVAHGRLLTIQSVALTPQPATTATTATTAAAASTASTASATQAAVTATAYSQLPGTDAASAGPSSATSTASTTTGASTSPAAAVPVSTTTTR